MKGWPMNPGDRIARRGLLIGLGVLTVHPVQAQQSMTDIDDRMLRREHYFQKLDEPAPDFALQNADGHPVALKDFRGKIVALDFVYTLCPDVCPLISERVAKIQRMIKGRALHDTVEFVSITADPVRDLPAVMKSYGTQHGLDSFNWIFLTSGPDRPDATRDLSARYHNHYRQEADGSITHGVVFHVIDGDGRLRGNFHGLDWTPDNLVYFLQALADQGRKPAGGILSSFWTSLKELF